MSLLTAKAVFFFYTISNILLFLCGCGVSSIGIYIWNETKRAGEFELIFLILGVLIILFSILGCYSRSSINKLNCYLYGFGLVFGAQLIVSIVGIVMKEKVKLCLKKIISPL